MRGAAVCIVAAGVALGGALVASSDAKTVRYAQADATVAIVGDKAFGAVSARRTGTDSAEATVEKGRVSIGGGTATVDATGTGTAAATARNVVLLGGRIRISSVTRTSTSAEPATGEIVGLRIDGQAYGPIRKTREIEVEGAGTLSLNGDAAGVELVTDELEVRIGVTTVSTFTREVATPTPTPTAKPKKTATPTPTPTPVRPPQRLTAGGYAFPVYGDVNYDSTFGASRAAPIITHQGSDIFAEFGAPAVAVKDGRITKVGTLDISGNRLWLITDTGDAFFYAHLSSFADRARNGARVEAGDVLGFIGNTGDAEPTPPHLHFEVHPGGINKDAVDPYPILRSWQADKDVPPGAWLQRLGADATERPGALVTVRDFIAE